jgi:hypothetical protein
MSKENTRKTRDELEPFFGNQGGAKLFIKAFIEPTNYIVSINESNADDIGNII